MSGPNARSDLVEIVKRNGDFKRNYGTLIGGYLYLRSIGVAGRRTIFWSGLVFTAVTAGLAWLQKHGLVTPTLPT